MNTDELFGPRNGARRVRIMVTMSTEAATNYDVRVRPRRGRHGLRADQLRARWPGDVGEDSRERPHGSDEKQRSCRVLMDLSGPRLRVEAVHFADSAGGGE